MDKAETYREGLSRKEARAKLAALIGGAGKQIALRNDSNGEEASLTNKSVGKLVSDPAALKSERNGFTREQHYAAASNIDSIFKHSVKLLERPDRHGNPDVTIHRFGAPLHFNDALALITVKESRQHGKKVYSIELMDMDKLGSMLEEAREKSPAPCPIQGVQSETKKRPGGALEEAGEAPLHTSPAPGLDSGGILTRPRLYVDNIRKSAP
jgi:hypothetical protein